MKAMKKEKYRRKVFLSESVALTYIAYGMKYIAAMFFSSFFHVKLFKKRCRENTCYSKALKNLVFLHRHG